MGVWCRGGFGRRRAELWLSSSLRRLGSIGYLDMGLLLAISAGSDPGMRRIQIDRKLRWIVPIDRMRFPLRRLFSVEHGPNPSGTPYLVAVDRSKRGVGYPQCLPPVSPTLRWVTVMPVPGL
jgi:hypothetical protein